MSNNRKKVLVVDDDENICKLCGNSLRNEGYQVYTTCRPENVLKIVDKENINLVLTDIKMPSLDGLEILRRLMESHPDIAVVVMTAYATMEVAIKAVNDGAYSFIHKPFHVNEMALAVKNALERQRLFQENIRLKTLVSLFKVSEQITGTLDIKDLLNTVASAVLKETDSKRAVIYYPDSETNELYARYAIGINEERMDNIRIPFDEGIVGAAFQNRNLVHVPNFVEEDSTYPHPLERELGNSALAVPMLSKEKILGVLSLFKNGRSLGFTEADKDVAAILTSQASIALDNAELILDLEILFLESMKSLAKTLDERDPFTHGHSHRVSKLARAIGQLMELSEDNLETLRHAGVLHDIGKIGIRDEILLKPGPLTLDEYEIIKTHPEKGYNILKPISRLNDVAEAVFCHHEWYNGDGYPRNLRNSEVPLAGSILAVADAYDTITTDRPYRLKQEHQIAIEIMKRASGTQFYPDVVQALEYVDVQKLNLY
ncbi:MAG: HD domain-containing phosphohydrolase [Candidatus Zhuqueibacterota bacterium]